MSKISDHLTKGVLSTEQLESHLQLDCSFNWPPSCSRKPGLQDPTRYKRAKAVKTEVH